MRKLRPDSNQAQLTPEETERLLEACRTMGYREAVEWAKTNLSIDTTTASLCRWYQVQSAELTQGRLRAALMASENFDAQLDVANLAAREANAIRAAYWDAVNSNDLEAIIRLGKLLLEHAKANRDTAKIELIQQRLAQYEEAANLARQKFEAAECRLADTKAAVARLGATGSLTPEALAEIEKAMGAL